MQQKYNFGFIKILHQQALHFRNHSPKYPWCTVQLFSHLNNLFFYENSPLLPLPSLASILLKWELVHVLDSSLVSDCCYPLERCNGCLKLWDGLSEGEIEVSVDVGRRSSHCVWWCNFVYSCNFKMNPIWYATYLHSLLISLYEHQSSMALVPAQVSPVSLK